MEGESMNVGSGMECRQAQMSFIKLDAEIDLATAIHAKTGRDLFDGITDRADRQAAARIAILMNRLEAEFGQAYQRIYGEPLPERKPIETETPRRRKAAS